MEQINPSRSFPELKAYLTLRGLSLAGLARKCGFDPALFQQMARQYWGTTRQPHGILTDAMLRALRKEIEELTEATSPETQGAVRGRMTAIAAKGIG